MDNEGNEGRERPIGNRQRLGDAFSQEIISCLSSLVREGQRLTDAVTGIVSGAVKDPGVLRNPWRGFGCREGMWH